MYVKNGSWLGELQLVAWRARVGALQAGRACVHIPHGKESNATVLFLQCTTPVPRLIPPAPPPVACTAHCSIC